MKNKKKWLYYLIHILLVVMICQIIIFATSYFRFVDDGYDYNGIFYCRAEFIKNEKEYSYIVKIPLLYPATTLMLLEYNLEEFNIENNIKNHYFVKTLGCFPSCKKEFYNGEIVENEELVFLQELAKKEWFD